MIFIHIDLQATEGEGRRAGRHRLQERAIRQTAGRRRRPPTSPSRPLRRPARQSTDVCPPDQILFLFSLSLDLFTEQRLNVTFQGLQREDLIFPSCKNAALLKTGRNGT